MCIFEKAKNVRHSTIKVKKIGAILHFVYHQLYRFDKFLSNMSLFVESFTFFLYNQVGEVENYFYIKQKRGMSIGMWDVVAKTADVVGIVFGSGSMVISIITLLNTKKIRAEMITRVEKSEYSQAIDEQVADLEAFKELLLSGENLDSVVFLNAMVLVKNIRISYESFLPDKLKRKIDNLYNHINENLYGVSGPYSKEAILKCINLLVYVITELKKEKKVL